MLFEIFTFSFMQRAIITGIAVAVLCSIIGLFLVLRRQSLFGDALSHVAFGGIALGLFVGIYPLWTAFLVSILSALGINKLRESTKLPGDASVAVLLSSGLALGVLFVSLSDGFTVNLFGFLFGSILLVSNQDMTVILIIAMAVIGGVCYAFQKLLYVTFDENQARVSGLNVDMLNYFFIVIACITVIASIRLVGVLLISSLIVIPNLTAIVLGKGFKQTILISSSFAIVSVVFGIILSYVANLAPSGTIVLTSTIIFLTTILIKYASLRVTKNKAMVVENSRKNSRL
jgi:zinc transport system permease protein